MQGSIDSPHSVHEHSVHEKIILSLIFHSVFVYPSEASFIHNRMADRACGRQLMTHNDRLINKLMHAREGFFLPEHPTRGMPFPVLLFCWGYVYKVEERYFHGYLVFETFPSILNEHDTWHI